MSFGRKDVEPGLYGIVIGALAGLVTSAPDFAPVHASLQATAGAMVGLGTALGCRRILALHVSQVRRDVKRAARAGRAPKARLRSRI